LSQFT